MRNAITWQETPHRYKFVTTGRIGVRSAERLNERIFDTRVVWSFEA